MNKTTPPFPANCQTTAMGIMPHTDIVAALALAKTLDIPFWPQLPNTSFYEDMYVQASEGFPGIEVDIEKKLLSFDRTKFDQELGAYSEHMDDPQYFALSPEYSRVYHRFLQDDLSGYTAIRGQNIGPVSFGFRVTDKDRKPIIYDDDARSIIYDFFQKKVNLQRNELYPKNRNAFVWLDEPGLGWVFSALSGYDDMRTKEDYRAFLSGIEGIRALHLCANVNLPYLLGIGVQLLSFDAYQMEIMPRGYASAVADFINHAGIICWGIVPTDSENLLKETPESLTSLLTGYWDVVARETGIDLKQVAEQSLISPARCCLKNLKKPGEGASLTEEQLVETAFSYLKQMSIMLRTKFGV